MLSPIPDPETPGFMSIYKDLISIVRAHPHYTQMNCPSSSKRSPEEKLPARSFERTPRHDQPKSMLGPIQWKPDLAFERAILSSYECFSS